MVGITEHSFEEDYGLIQLLGIGLTRACQRFDQPEGAHVERAFLARKTIDAGVWRVAVHQTVADQTTPAGPLENSFYCAEHAGIVRSHKENQRHDEKGGIQVFASIELR